MRQCKRFVLLLGIFVFATGMIWSCPGYGDGGKININKDRAEQIATLENIGPTIATRIVEYRMKNGPFKTPEDVMKVKGIGQKTFDEIKDRIVVK